LQEGQRPEEEIMGLNIMRSLATPESNAAAAELLGSFYSLREQGVIFGFMTNKIFKKFDELLAAGKQIEEYDMDQLRSSAGKDVRDHYAKLA
jgi:hypothetical protein